MRLPCRDQPFLSERLCHAVVEAAEQLVVLAVVQVQASALAAIVDLALAAGALAGPGAVAEDLVLLDWSLRCKYTDSRTVGGLPWQ